MKKIISIVIAAMVLAYISTFALTALMMARVCPDNFQLHWMGGQCVWTIHFPPVEFEYDVQLPEKEGIYMMNFRVENGKFTVEEEEQIKTQPPMYEDSPANAKG